VGPVCRCSLLIVPEELESQWQQELAEKSNLRHRIVLLKSNVAILKRQAEDSFTELAENITSEFPSPKEVEVLDVVVTTMERMGSRVGKRAAQSQNDGMRGFKDGLAQVHWARIIIDEVSPHAAICRCLRSLDHLESSLTDCLRMQGHELGGKGLSELAEVLGATLASATWVLSATPNRAGSGHFKQVSSVGMTNFLQPGLISSEVIVRTPKEMIALPPLVCQVKWLEFDTARQARLDSCEHRCYQYAHISGRVHMCADCLNMPVDHRLVGRFAWIHSADTQQLVEERNNTIPE